MAINKSISIGRYDCGAFITFFAYSSCTQILPMALVIMSDDLGFSLKEGGFAEGSMLQIARWLPGIFSALVCSFIAAKFGKRKTLGAGISLIGISMALSSIAPSYNMVFIALLLAGLANGLTGTLSSPFVRNLHPTESGRYINFLNSFWAIGTLFTVLVSGGLLSMGVSWRIVLFGTSLLTLPPAFILLLPQTKGKEYPECPEVLHPRAVVHQMRCVLVDRRFLYFFTTMMIFAGGEGVLMFWSASYIQLNFAGSAWAAGVGTAIFAVGMIVSRVFVGYFIHQDSFKTYIIGFAVGGFIITLGFPLITELWLLFIALFFSGMATAPLWPSLISYGAERLSHLDKTTTMILITLSATPGRIIFTFLVGYIATKTGSLSAAFYLVPTYFFVVAIMVYLEGRHPLTEVTKKL